jgi:NADH-quinone oxidoreductase subunit K
MPSGFNKILSRDKLINLAWIVVILAVLGFAFFKYVWPNRERFEPTLVNFMMLSFLLFVVGIAGVLSRRNIIIIFMSLELILNAVNLNLIAFSRYFQLNQTTFNEAFKSAGMTVNPLAGPVFTIFIIVVAAAEAAVGLGVVISLFRNRETVAIDEIDLLKF